MSEIASEKPKLPPFQFTLGDIFAGMLSAAYPVAFAASLDRSVLFENWRVFGQDVPGMALFGTAVSGGLVMGVLAAAFYRRHWQSNSIWFVPPFALFFWNMFLFSFIGTSDWPRVPFLAYPALFSAVFCYQMSAREGVGYPWLGGLVGALVPFVLSAPFAPNTDERVIWRNTLGATLNLGTLRRAQEAFFEKDRDGDGVLEYAENLRELADQSPFLLSNVSLVNTSLAGADSTDPSAPKTPVNGYYFRILKEQGSGGQRFSFRDANGKLTWGFILVAYPAIYQRTGIYTFAIDKDGKVHKRDLGVHTRSLVESLTTFDANDMWKLAE